MFGVWTHRVWSIVCTQLVRPCSTITRLSCPVCHADFVGYNQTHLAHLVLCKSSFRVSKSLRSLWPLQSKHLPQINTRQRERAACSTRLLSPWLSVSQCGTLAIRNLLTTNTQGLKPHTHTDCKSPKCRLYYIMLFLFLPITHRIHVWYRC